MDPAGLLLQNQTRFCCLSCVWLQQPDRGHSGSARFISHVQQL